MKKKTKKGSRERYIEIFMEDSENIRTFRQVHGNKVNPFSYRGKRLFRRIARIAHDTLLDRIFGAQLISEMKAKWAARGKK